MKEKKEHEHSEKFVGFTLDELNTKFPTLIEELKGGGMSLDSVMQVNEREGTQPPHFRDYSPSILDFLKRANTEEECEEVISYCLSQNEITEEEAEQLRIKLKKGGPKAFGTRESGYYNSKI